MHVYKLFLPWVHNIILMRGGMVSLYEHKNSLHRPIDSPHCMTVVDLDHCIKKTASVDHQIRHTAP